METAECGAACLAMVLAAFGRWESLDAVRDSCGASRDGTSAADLVAAADRGERDGVIGQERLQLCAPLLFGAPVGGLDPTAQPAPVGHRGPGGDVVAVDLAADRGHIGHHRPQHIVAGGQLPGKMGEFGVDQPLGRAGEPAELAPLYVLLASDESSYTTGGAFGANGGKGNP